MFGKLLPKDPLFFDDFERHAVITTSALEKLLEMFNNSSELKLRAQEIAKFEKQADEITHHCKESLHKTFITPFERTDIYRLITRMDDITDLVEDIASRIVTYKITHVNKEAKDLANILYAAFQEVQLLVIGLRKLKDVDDMKQRFLLVHDYENDGDNALQQALQKLFDEEKNPIEIIKWKEIYELLEEAIDRCKDVSNIIEGVLIEHS